MKVRCAAHALTLCVCVCTYLLYQSSTTAAQHTVVVIHKAATVYGSSVRGLDGGCWQEQLQLEALLLQLPDLAVYPTMPPSSSTAADLCCSQQDVPHQHVAFFIKQRHVLQESKLCKLTTVLL
jgi:hypothetical protein